MFGERVSLPLWAVDENGAIISRAVGCTLCTVNKSVDLHRPSLILAPAWDGFDHWAYRGVNVCSFTWRELRGRNTEGEQTPHSI